MPSVAERPRTAAIVQSSYIPWKGYFDLINAVDAFTVYDDVQYTRRDWRNRNKIKTRDGVTLIEVPLTLGVVGALLLPVWAAIAAVAAIVTDAVVTVEKRTDEKS